MSERIFHFLIEMHLISDSKDIVFILPFLYFSSNLSSTYFSLEIHYLMLKSIFMGGGGELSMYEDAVLSKKDVKRTLRLIRL